MFMVVTQCNHPCMCPFDVSVAILAFSKHVTSTTMYEVMCGLARPKLMGFEAEGGATRHNKEELKDPFFKEHTLIIGDKQQICARNHNKMLHFVTSLRKKCIMNSYFMLNPDSTWCNFCLGCVRSPFLCMIAEACRFERLTSAVYSSQRCRSSHMPSSSW